MASVETAPNDSSDDRLGTESEITGEEAAIDECVEEIESDDTDNQESQKAVVTINDLKKKRKVLTAQYNRVLKSRDENVRKHALVLENKKTASEGLKLRHKTILSELKAQNKRERADLKNEHMAELKAKEAEKAVLRTQVKTFWKEQKVDEAEFLKLQAAFTKEKDMLSSSRQMCVDSRRSAELVTELNKELGADVKKLKKQLKDDMTEKFAHEEKMLQIQLEREMTVYETERTKRDGKQESDQTALESRNASNRLAFSLRKQTKDDDLVRKEASKKKKDVEVSNNVGAIAAGLRNKQRQINNGGFHNNNGQFNAHLSLDSVSNFVRQQIN
jgi:hypothetical protein